YNLAHEGALPERFNLIGVSRSDKPHEDFQKEAREAIAQFSRTEPDKDVLDGLIANVRYGAGTFDQDDMYDRLGEQIEEFDKESDVPFNRCFYLSTAPEFFP